MNSNREKGKETRGRARGTRPNTGYQPGDKPYAERGGARGGRGERGRGRGRGGKRGDFKRDDNASKEMTAEDQFDMLFGAEENKNKSPTKKTDK